VLVPASMYLFGDADWWLPCWLDRLLPNLAIESAEQTQASAPPVRTVR
jgi:RND superfamily putative drug exporter